MDGNIRARALSKEQLEANRLELLNATINQPSGYPPLEIIGWDELSVTPPHHWIWKGVVMNDTAVMLFGPTSTYKTCVCFALMTAVLLGKDLAGRRVKKGKVLYLAAEGKSGLYQRLRALAIFHGVERIEGLRLITSAPQLGDENALETLLNVFAEEEFDLVVIDTGFKHFAKFDLSSPLGGQAASWAHEEIRRKSGAAVILVHHATKGSKGKGVVEYAGMPVIGGIDTEIAVDSTSPLVTLWCRKQRSAKEFDPIKLQIQWVTLPELDEDGEKIDVPVITDCDAGGPKSEGGKSDQIDSKTVVKLLRALRDLGGRGTAKEIFMKADVSEANFHLWKPKLLMGQLISHAGERQPYVITEKGMEALMKLSENSHES